MGLVCVCVCGGGSPGVLQPCAADQQQGGGGGREEGSEEGEGLCSLVRPLSGLYIYFQARRLGPWRWVSVRLLLGPAWGWVRLVTGGERGRCMVTRLSVPIQFVASWGTWGEWEVRGRGHVVDGHLTLPLTLLRYHISAARALFRSRRECGLAGSDRAQPPCRPFTFRPSSAEAPQPGGRTQPPRHRPPTTTRPSGGRLPARRGLAQEERTVHLRVEVVQHPHLHARHTPTPGPHPHAPS